MPAPLRAVASSVPERTVRTFLVAPAPAASLVSILLAASHAPEADARAIDAPGSGVLRVDFAFADPGITDRIFRSGSEPAALREWN
ncbi:hypothetical protein [Dokdonella koreensis]|uniref:Uncharacterized protein n=1 Tax=Dokdonella koreensis DS-123 TaxID=1300342 RepID=A0A167HCK8_9GAMM|nr:hypothetical protein [Dokdonella koreensis]ANB19815.1 Hypothetical protein I596_3832 [Dokdonella koreensis DS-123]